MSAINNGGPAFPTDTDNYGSNYSGKGMTLRDYFAAKAMQGMVTAEFGTPYQPRLWAKTAYDMADAMLEAREEQP